jgi:hypothetical protein
MAVPPEMLIIALDGFAYVPQSVGRDDKIHLDLALTRSLSRSTSPFGSLCLLGTALGSGKHRSRYRHVFHSGRGKGFQNRAGILVSAESRGTVVAIQRASSGVQCRDLASVYEEAPFASVAVIKPGLPPKERTVAKWADNELVSHDRLRPIDSTRTCCPKVHGCYQRNFRTKSKR